MLGVVPPDVVDPAVEAATEFARETGLGLALGSSFSGCVYLNRLEVVSDTRPSGLSCSLWFLLRAGGAEEGASSTAGVGGDRWLTVFPFFDAFVASVSLKGMGESARLADVFGSCDGGVSSARRRESLRQTLAA